ncbi:hypothetical protein, unlikely [Trypanosoma brucei gambiense DAL972]|uniref:Uncharacterized protein n=1 Tax=Trypanosoma brucei gambiense (strain MHOM/CI/86/DAL972) TaxID=679716 RepID=C9ZPC3_TRYB9|nr:hypothetical protein, unlikely [Trypanosoma brucei gambiense DAL972]CBH11251.1 hypothetical protein, unlikely [Trypanosoma brucei gambiense DAL972]|eukprot:XP_011773538.1 hypothetical protein, unlikely [Trypanosoma brucei gambiense DAL972]
MAGNDDGSIVSRKRFVATPPAFGGHPTLGRSHRPPPFFKKKKLVTQHKGWERKGSPKTPGNYNRNSGCAVTLALLQLVCKLLMTAVIPDPGRAKQKVNFL